MAIPKQVGSPDSIALGGLGAVIITNTSAYTGDWAVIHALTDTVFSVLTSQTVRLNSTTSALPGSAAFTLPAGHDIYGRFSAITLTSGSCIAYSAVATP